MSARSTGGAASAPSGDAALAARLRERVGGRHRVVAAATVAGSEVRAATLGCALDAGFEIGSITKGFTGLLYVDALERGEIEPQTTLGELLPLGESPAAAVTLSSLSTHTSGLPRLPPGALNMRTLRGLWLHGANPYGEDLMELVGQAARVQKLGTPRSSYSNLGFELLGHAVAAAAGTTYAELVATRLAGPLGLTSVYLPHAPDDLRPSALLGTSRLGRPQQAWTGEALGPAGGVRASIEDMGRFTLALLDGTAPGLTALDPVTKVAGVVRIGAAWMTLERGGRQITWHNGGTGGFRSWMGIDRAAGTGVVLISATARSVDRAGMTMLTELTDAADVTGATEAAP